MPPAQQDGSGDVEEGNSAQVATPSGYSSEGGDNGVLPSLKPNSVLTEGQLTILGGFLGLFLSTFNTACLYLILGDSSAPRGAFVVANYVPIVIVQLFSPFWVLKRLTYKFRLLVFALCGVVGGVGLTVASDSDLHTRYAAAVIGTAGIGLAESTLLALLAFFHHASLPWYAVGRALGQVAGPILFALVRNAHVSVLATILGVLPLLPIGVFVCVDTPFHLVEAWAPRSVWSRIRAWVTRYGKLVDNPFALAPDSSSYLLTPNTLGRPTQVLAELDFSRQWRLVKLSLPILLPLLSVSLLVTVAVLGVLPVIGWLPHHSVGSKDYHRMFVITYLLGQSLGQSYLGAVQAMAPRQGRRGTCFTSKTWYFVLASVLPVAAVVALCYERRHASLAVVLACAVLAGVCEGAAWLNTLYRFARFGGRSVLDVLTRNSSIDILRHSSDTALHTSTSSDMPLEDTAEREFLLGMAPVASSVGRMIGAFIALKVSSALRHHCWHEFPDMRSYCDANL